MVVDVRGGSGRRICYVVLVMASLGFAACSTSRPVPSLPPPNAPVPSSVVGIASWYGPGFNGRPTSSGEIYNQDDLTAASLIFPLGTRLMVTNLENGRSCEVRINDHGPYVEGRKIDLSEKAASILGIIGPGTAEVRMDVIKPSMGAPPVGGRYYVQLGAFIYPDNARRMFDALSARYSDVSIDPVLAGGTRYYRVRMGAFASRIQAEQRALRLSRNGYPVLIVSK